MLIIFIIIAALLFYYYSMKKENFWMIPDRQVSVEKVLKDPSSNTFFQVPNFQSVLSPRFSNVNYGPNLSGRLPHSAQLGVPHDPLMQQQSSLVEGFQDNQQSGAYIVGAPKIPENPFMINTDVVPSNNNNYDQIKSTIAPLGATQGWPTDSLANLGSTPFMTPDGELKQAIVYDRYIYSNRNSRLRGQGDPIRGDLPIVPINGNWFIPSQANTPQLSLQQGAMNVMGGVNNETNNSLANLIYNATGGANTTIGGVDMAQTNMSHQVYGAVAAAQGDVQVTSFP